MTNKELTDSLMNQHEKLTKLMQKLFEKNEIEDYTSVISLPKEDRIVWHKLREAQRQISDLINGLILGKNTDRRAITNHLSNKMFELVQEVIKTEDEMISIGFLDTEEFNGENDVSVWTRRVHPGKTSPNLTAPFGYGEGEPYRALADTLMREFQNKVEVGLQMRGCSIRIQDNQCHFYISVSIPLTCL